MDTLIEVEKKTHYGSEYIYAVNDLAHKACALWGQKSFTPKNIEHLKALGFKVVQVMQANGKVMQVGEL